jgi:hypothetical protein
MKTYICDGYWNDTKESFFGMIVADYEWNLIEDAQDEKIFYYTDGLPVIGNHGEFTISKIFKT